MMFRSARSFMSTTRFQTIRRGSMPKLVAVVDVVVEHRGQQVVGQLDGVEIAGEVEVDVLHRHHLGVAAAGGAALHAEARPQRRLAQADARLLADAVQTVAQADAGGGLALAGGRRRDGGHQHQLAGRFVCQPAIQIERDFGFVLAVVFQVVVGDAQLGGDLFDRQTSSSGGRFQCRAAEFWRSRTSISG